MTQTLPDANDFLFSGGVPSAKFDTVGVTVTGTITAAPATQQQTDFDTGAPKFWDDGRPMLQVVVDVATDLRDPQLDDDDGTRRLYVRGKHLTAAVRDAVRRSGAKKLEVGATLSVTYSGDDEPKRRGASGAKQYTASYTPAADTLLGASDNPQTSGSSEFKPASDPLTSDPRLTHLTAEQVAGARAAGWSADRCAEMFPAPPA